MRCVCCGVCKKAYVTLLFGLTTGGVTKNEKEKRNCPLFYVCCFTEKTPPPKILGGNLRKFSDYSGDHVEDPGRSFVGY